jgi:pyruvate dehydrogenase E2 component (dihydrolipoamide acetyltransferase)
MAEIITMPRLSDTMTEGVVAKWLKKVGDKVEEGDILAEIETDKATMEFESFNEGTLLYIGLKEGETAPVDSLLAIIGEDGEDVDAIIKEFEKSNSAKQETKQEKKSELIEDNKKSTEPIAEKKPIETVQQEVVMQKPVRDENERVFISPLAKKLAEERNINIKFVKGTGENGRIVKSDIENYVPVPSNLSHQTVSFSPNGEESFEDIPNSQMRKVIARRLAESKFKAPHYYLNIEVDMDPAISFRKQFNSQPDTKISFNDIVVKATALALKKHPQVNSQWFDDKMRLNHHVHIGVAVAVPDGLVVPVVRFADEQSLQQINLAVKDLAGRARNKKLTPQEMEGSTFTISNLGMFGISEFTSIINQPNSAILSVGAIIEKPVVKNKQIVVGNTMKLTLACDHRTVDGATGAMFLQTLREYLEKPILLLI